MNKVVADQIWVNFLLGGCISLCRPLSEKKEWFSCNGAIKLFFAGVNYAPPAWTIAVSLSLLTSSARNLLGRLTRIKPGLGESLLTPCKLAFGRSGQDVLSSNPLATKILFFWLSNCRDGLNPVR